jgi:uncharacterized protein YdaU (DUF1376 family)
MFQFEEGLHHLRCKQGHRACRAQKVWRLATSAVKPQQNKSKRTVAMSSGSSKA